MAAAEVYLPEGFFVTTLSQALTSSSTTVNLTAVPSDVTKGYLVIEPLSATKREVVHFTSVGASTVTAADDSTDGSDASGRGCHGSITAGANTSHDQGVSVIIAASYQYWKRLYDTLDVEHNMTTGLHELTTPKITTSINDSNGNEIIKTPATPSAVNEFTLTNAATGNAPVISVTGDDENVGLIIKPKGTGSILIQEGGVNPWRTITLNAGVFKPTTTAGCASVATVEAGTNDIDYDVLDFDKATDENAFCNIPMPDSYDGGVIQFQFIWTAAAGTAAQNVVMELSGRSLANDDAVDQAVGTAVEVSDALIATGDVHISDWSGDVTLAGTPAGGQWWHLELMRDISEDNLDADARIIAVKIRYRQSKYSD